MEEITKNEHLSEKGVEAEVFKKSKEAFEDIYGKISENISDIQKNVSDLQKQNNKELAKTLDFDPSQLTEIRSWLRSLDQKDRYAVIREASQNKMAGANEIMAAVTNSAFPLLAGFKAR